MARRSAATDGLISAGETRMDGLVSSAASCMPSMASFAEMGLLGEGGRARNRLPLVTQLGPWSVANGFAGGQKYLRSSPGRRRVFARAFTFGGHAHGSGFPSTYG